MATLGPSWQMMDSFGLQWTNVNEIWNLSSFWPGGLNGGVKSYFTSGFGHQVVPNSAKLTFDPPSLTKAKKTYSENFITIRPQIAELGTIWWPKPEVN